MAKLTLGLDIGIASVGWAVIDSESLKLIDSGVRLFEEASADNNKSRGEGRKARRNKRRKNLRKKELIDLFIKYKLIDDSTEFFDGITDFYNENMTTPYHIRVKGLKEKLSDIELMIAFYNILKHRGIFYLDDLDEGQEVLETEKFPCEIQLSRLTEDEIVRDTRNTFRNSEYLREVDVIASVSCVDENMLEEYKALVKRKREYDDGPGDENSSSPYKLKVKDENGNVKSIFIEKLRGKCSVFNDEFRESKASMYAQLFNLLNDLNNTKFDGESLSKEEKEEIINWILKKEPVSDKELSKSNIEKALGRKIDEIKGSRVDKSGNSIFTNLQSYLQIRNIIGENYLNSLELIEKVEFISGISEILTVEQHEEGKYRKLSEFEELNNNITNKQLQELSALKSGFSGFHSLSRRVLKDLIPSMLEENKNSQVLMKENGYLEHLYKKYRDATSLSVDDLEFFPSAVRRSYGQALRIVKAVEKKYGELDSIVIEMARENSSDEKKEKEKELQKFNEVKNKEIKKILNECTFGKDPKGQAMLRLQLYNSQDGKDIYTGVPFNDLKDVVENKGGVYEIDHIIPQSVSFDDSFNNKVLTTSSINNDKGNMTPYQYLGQNFDKLKSELYDDLFKSKKINRKKYNYLTFTEDINKYTVRMGFVNRNLVDTRYATRLVYLQLFNFYRSKDIKTKVITLNGSVTSVMRKKLNIKKDRDESHYHHAVDAALVAYGGTCDIIKEMSKINVNDAVNTDTGEIVSDEKYNEYLDSIQFVVDQNIRNAKHKISHRVVKKKTGELFNATIYSTRKIDGQDKLISKVNIREKGKENANIGRLDKIFDESNVNIVSLMQLHDNKTYKILQEIYREYKDKEIELDGKKIKNETAFYKYEIETGQKVRKYAKNGDGPVIKHIKYTQENLGKHIDLSSKYMKKDAGENDKKVVSKSINEFRSDVYYNPNAKQKYIHFSIPLYLVKSSNNKIIINQDDYNTLKEQRGITDEYSFVFSLYKNDIIEVESSDGKQKVLYGSNGPSRPNAIYVFGIETKEIGGNKQPNISLGNKVLKINKLSTDILGNVYKVRGEKLELEFPYKVKTK